MTNQQTKDGKRYCKSNEETSRKGISLNYTPQHEDIDLKQKDEMEIEENNLLVDYNPTKAMSNNVTIEVIQEGPNHLDFKAVLEEYKNI